MEDDEEIVYVNPTLFLNYRGDPLMFDIKPCKERRRLRKLVEKGNGVVVLAPGPYSVTFVPEDVQYDGYDEVFSVGYIYECCKFAKQLDLKKFKVNNKSRLKSEFDVMDVFMRKISWNRAHVKWGMKATTSTSKEVPVNERRVPYSLREKRLIINYIIENKGFSLVKGVTLWHDMSKALETKGSVRTWQSLKEHYRKQILPSIELFGLKEKHVLLFKKNV